mmetsp:Transcript_50807/g.93974  ORF Transcript_50807/g.93974 Transcript_50807/m.93974 type:complete len:268 (-) Transcript_50807:290-1093(-)
MRAAAATVRRRPPTTTPIMMGTAAPLAPTSAAEEVRATAAATTCGSDDVGLCLSCGGALGTAAASISICGGRRDSSSSPPAIGRPELPTFTYASVAAATASFTYEKSRSSSAFRARTNALPLVLVLPVVSSAAGPLRPSSTRPRTSSLVGALDPSGTRKPAAPPPSRRTVYGSLLSSSPLPPPIRASACAAVPTHLTPLSPANRTESNVAGRPLPPHRIPLPSSDRYVPKTSSAISSTAPASASVNGRGVGESVTEKGGMRTSSTAG